MSIKSSLKTIRYACEAAFLYALFFFFGALPPETASNLGGWLGRNIGTRLAASRKARANIKLALPDVDQDTQNRIIKGMWENLGRVIAEYPHLERISHDYTSVEGTDILDQIAQHNLPAVFFGAHIANWEINGAASVTRFKRPIELTYRKPNNPWTAALLHKARTLNGRIKAHPKSRDSGRQIIQTLKDGGTLGILIDQKYNEGVEVAFFDAPAMTNPIFVQLCQKYRCPLIPVRTIREESCNFRLIAYPPLALFDSEGKALPVEDVIRQAHDILESWIREKPEQWLWLHRRWKSKPEIKT